MDASFDPAQIKPALIILGAAGLVIPLGHRLRLSPVLSFMLVGAVVGPHGFGRLARHLPWLDAVTIDDPDAIALIARLGVMLLLFMIGLELSFERLWTMRRLVFGLGALVVVLSTLALAGLGVVLGARPGEAIPLALAGAMSSTAIVVQVLAEERRLATASGRASFAVLLFQDLSVVPVLLALGLLAAGTAGPSLASVGIAAAKAMLAVGAILAIGRLALRPVFRGVARTGNPELFMAACLLVVIAAALVTAAAGLSTALGALIGGLLLAETEYRKQVEVTIEPFKGLLVGVFLISVGLGFDPAELIAVPGLVLVMAGVLIGAKLAVIFAASRLFGLAAAPSIEVALLLAPAGEFGLVILAIAAARQLVGSATAHAAVVVAMLTMALIPLFFRLGRRLARRFDRGGAIDPALVLPLLAGEPPGVIIAGFGRVGRTVADMLEKHGVAYVAIDRDADRVAREHGAGRRIYFGDMTRTDLLRRLDLGLARALVVTLDDYRSADALVAAARAERPDLLIVARARDAGHAAHLYRTGASDAVPETIEASLQLSEAVLLDLGVPAGPVIASIHDKRAEIQAGIRTMAPEAPIRRLGARRLRDATTAAENGHELRS
ncbi:MAG: cation:proton antiporter [Acetobacteraceae bacterium]|nr:cation:proton antiporter [Acetobacteraceae bacterium]